MSAYDALPVPAFEAAFDVRVDLGPAEDHLRTSAGRRRVVPILGGAITGGFEAQILAGGADWQTIRDDGTIEIDGRYSARTPDGGLLLLSVQGLRTATAPVLERLARFEDVDPHEYYFRTTVMIETAHPALGELQRSIFIASAERRAATVRYRAHRLL